MMTPLETQRAVVPSVAASLPGTSSAEVVSEASSSAAAAETFKERGSKSGTAGCQQNTIAEVQDNSLKRGEAPTETYIEPQLQQPPPYAAVVQQQQPMTSASTTYPWDRQVFPLVSVAAATSASADMTAWMPKPLVTTLCPPGLEYFVELSQLIFLDETSMVMTGFSAAQASNIGIPPRRFSVRNAQGQQVYIADTMEYETVSHAVLGFVDRTGQVLLIVKMKRNTCPICCTGKCTTCLLDGTVEAPPGIVVGTVEQQSSGRNVSFVIKSTEGSQLLYLEGPEPCSFCVDGNAPQLSNSPFRPFKIVSLDRQHQIGKIEGQPTFYTSFNYRCLTNVNVTFPADLDVRVKATIAGGATMLHRYFFGIYGGPQGHPGSFNRNQTRPSNSVFNHAPNHFHHHPIHRSHNNHHFGNRTSHFGHTSSHHTSHHHRRH